MPLRNPNPRSESQLSSPSPPPPPPPPPPPQTPVSSLHSADEIPVSISKVLPDVDDYDSKNETDPEEELDPEEESELEEESESDPEEGIQPIGEGNESDPDEKIEPEEIIVEEKESEPEEEIIVEENESDPEEEIDPEEIVMAEEYESDPEEEIDPEIVMAEENESDPEEDIDPEEETTNPEEVMVEENKYDHEEEEIDPEEVMVEENKSDREEEEIDPEEVMVEGNKSDSEEEEIDPEEVLDEENLVMKQEVEIESKDRKESVSNEKNNEYLQQFLDENMNKQGEKDRLEISHNFCYEEKKSLSNVNSRVDEETPKNVEDEDEMADVIEKEDCKKLEFVVGELDKNAMEVNHALTKVEINFVVGELDKNAMEVVNHAVTKVELKDTIEEPVPKSKRKRQNRKKKQVMKLLSEEHEKKKLVDCENVKSKIYSQEQGGPIKSFKKNKKKKKYKFWRGEPEDDESTTKYSSKQRDEHIAECSSSSRHREELPSRNSSFVGSSGQIEFSPPRLDTTRSSKRLYSTLESTPERFADTQVRQDYESYERAPQRARLSHEIYERAQPRSWLGYQAESAPRFVDASVYGFRSAQQPRRLDYNISQRQQQQPRRFPDYGIPRTNLRYGTTYSYRPEQSQSYPGYARSNYIQPRHEMAYNGRSFSSGYNRMLSQSYARQYNDHVDGNVLSSRYPTDRFYSRWYD